MIVGAGAIGMEFRYVLANYGVDVTIIEFMDRVLPSRDVDVSKVIAKEYKKLGVKVLTSTGVQTVTDNGDSVTVTYGTRRATTVRSPSTRCSCRSVSRPRRRFRPGAHGCAAHRTQRHRDRRLHACTNVDGIYAIGDVTHKLQLARRGGTGWWPPRRWPGAETMTLGDYRFMPRATFCQPQVASFGLTEAQARTPIYNVKATSSRSRPTAGRRAWRPPPASIKLVTNADTDELLGGHLVGDNASPRCCLSDPGPQVGPDRQGNWPATSTRTPPF